jgi:hypothetical protein
MRRTRRNEILYSGYPSRIKAVEAVAAVLRRAGSPEALAAAAAELKGTASQLTSPASGIRHRQVAILMEALTFLVRWVAAVRSAEVDADRFLRSAKVAARDVSRELDGNAEDECLERVVASISGLSDIDGVPDVARLLLCIPLPLPLFVEVQRPSPREHATARPAKAAAVVVAFTCFQLNGVAFANPHTVQPDILYDLEVAVRVSHWPPAAQRLVLEVMSVEPPAAYALPTFSFDRPTGSPPFTVSQTGRLLVHHPIALYARPLQFTYKARFEPSDAESQVSVEGHRHLRMQCFDPARQPQSGYSLVDTRVLAIRDQVRTVVSVPDKELNDFLVLLTALGGIAGQSLQSNIFPRKYSEEEFQKELTKLLRQNPRIGSQLEEHPHAAGGITDLSFHGIRLELKSEQDQLVTVDSASAFVQQTAQYVSGSDRRLGILCILDCSAKTQAPGLVENDILLVPVPPPGGNGAPVLIVVVIIRGNLPRPSNLSR